MHKKKKNIPQEIFFLYDKTCCWKDDRKKDVNFDCHLTTARDYRNSTSSFCWWSFATLVCYSEWSYVLRISDFLHQNLNFKNKAFFYADSFFLFFLYTDGAIENKYIQAVQCRDVTDKHKLKQIIWVKSVKQIQLLDIQWWDTTWGL